MNLEGRPVIFLGQEEGIFKHYIFTKKMWNNKGKFRISPKDDEYGVIIFDFINEYHALHPKYADTDAATTTLGYT